MRGYSFIIKIIRILLGLRRSDISMLSSGFEIEESPRSLNGCDKMLLPKILKDFPDFDVTLAKTYVKDYLNEQLGNHTDLTIHNVVIAKYLKSAIHKTIVFQAALCWTENGTTLQKRYELNYTYMVTGDSEVAANCPNCGGALGYSNTVCPYCDSRVANALKNTWKFTEMKET